jgi:hypothetical protein
MKILEKIENYLTESNLEWKAGGWVVQKHDGWNIWMLLVNKQKNGGWAAITHTDEYGGVGNASKGSITNAYPPPVPTTEKAVPAKILLKIKKKQKQLNIKFDMNENNQAIDSDYLQRSIKGVISDIKKDPDEKMMVPVLKWINTRLNQSYPDGDVTYENVVDILREVGARGKMKKAGTTYLEIMDFIWDN